MALGSTQPLNRNEYQGYLLRGKGRWCIVLTTLPPSCANCLEIWEPQPCGTLRACAGLYWDCFTFTTVFYYPTALCVQCIWVTYGMTFVCAAFCALDLYQRHSVSHSHYFVSGQKCGSAGNRVYTFQSMWRVHVNVTIRRMYMYQSAQALHTGKHTGWILSCSASFTSAEVNAWSCTSNSTICLEGMYRDKFTHSYLYLLVHFIVCLSKLSLCVAGCSLMPHDWRQMRCPLLSVQFPHLVTRTSMACRGEFVVLYV
jgi:hypothetical protein